VVIPNWNGAAWLPGCLGALAAQTFRAFETVLVDNGSSDGSVALVRRDHPDVRVVTFGRNRGFAAAANAGIRAGAPTPYVALLNTDTRPRPGWLESLVAAMVRAGPEVGCLASRMLRMEDPAQVDDAGDGLSWHGVAFKRGHGEPAAAYAREEDVFSPCAGAALYRRPMLEEVGGFDERFFAYLEDVDLGLRCRLRGYRCRYVPGAEVLHHGHGAGIARGRYVRLTTRNRLALFAKSIPAPLLRRHVGRLAYGQWYFLVVSRRPLHSLLGYLGFALLLPHVLRERRRILTGRRIADEALDGMLARDLGAPTLRQALAARRHHGRTAL
jgi:GT2 family glycosyltransferase